MKKLSAILLALALMQTPSWSETLKVDNTTRSYVVYAPANLGTGRPLLISCHGMNQDANYQKGMLQIESVADTAKFVTVFPEGINKGWELNGDKDLKFMEAIIDAMVSKYGIDRNRVYISGFSMGGMFTYHCMNRMADKFAAFAPISGYPMGGGTYTSSRPVPIIHTHGTSDDVVGFSGVSSILSGWVKRNGCSTKAKVVKNYRNAPHITRHTWSGGENGVEVVLMEMADKGHWISNDYGVKTGEEIWNFCKRYSLDLKDPSVKLIMPNGGYNYITFGGASEVPPLTVKATTSDPDGEVAKVAFYLGDELVSEQTEAPFTCTFENFVKGENIVRAVVTDVDGHTGSTQRSVNVEEPTGTYVFSKVFNSEACVPDGWTTYDGKERRVGFSSGYTSGSRVFHFTGSQKDFEWGLYTRNAENRNIAGYARFGEKATNSSLTLYPGRYQLYYRVANWNCENFSPVTIALEDLNGQQKCTHTFTPSSNIGNSASNSFSGTKLENFIFDIHEKGRYVITFYTAEAPWADLVVGQVALMRKGEPSGISEVEDNNPIVRVEYYNMAGLCVEPTTPGMYIRKNIYQNGTFKSHVMVKK